MSDTTKLKENALKATMRNLGQVFLKAGAKATAEDAISHIAVHSPLLALLAQQAEELGLKHLLDRHEK